MKEVIIENSGIDKLKTKVFEALGEASMCWDEIPTGVFDSTNAERIGNELMGFIAEYEKQVSDKVKKIISEKIEKYDDLVTDVDFNAGKVESLQELYTLIDIEEKL